MKGTFHQGSHLLYAFIPEKKKCIPKGDHIVKFLVNKKLDFYRAQGTQGKLMCPQVRVSLVPGPFQGGGERISGIQFISIRMFLNENNSEKKSETEYDTHQQNEIVLNTINGINGSLQIKVHCVNLIRNFVMAKRSQSIYMIKIFEIYLNSFVKQVTGDNK